MSAKYLDIIGLSHLWTAMNALFARKSDVAADFDSGTVSATGGILTIATGGARTYAVADITTSMGTVGGTTRTVGLALDIANDAENYILLRNLDTTNKASLTLTAVRHGGSAVSVAMPDTLPEVPAGSAMEMSVIVRTIGGSKTAVITASSTLTTQNPSQS